MNDLMMAMMAAKAVGGSGSGGLRGANGCLPMSCTSGRAAH